jgi:hypothetical protein
MAAAASRVDKLPPVSAVHSPACIAPATADSTAPASAANPRCRSIRAPARFAAAGLAIPVPAMPGALP